MIRGTCVGFDADYINDMFGLTCEDDEYESFASSLTNAKRNKIVADLCEDNTKWTVAPKGSRSIKRLALKNQARGWNHFLKASLMPTSHNEIVSEERMAMLYFIIMGRKINVGKIIVNETFKCIETDKSNILFPLLITNLCLRHNVPKMS
ncbi:hypothetical protein V6N12_068462 [Hibiscus sabdariffa]|uniref:Putative plant transposon protein domain-containing protein n=1 Tax=Hibiscus sabdariffa TaxID=183260 RepID=A0ABR2FQ24_9ROSI